MSAEKAKRQVITYECCNQAAAGFILSSPHVDFKVPTRGLSGSPLRCLPPVLL